MARYVNLDEVLNILENSLNYSENELGNTDVEYKKGCIAAIKDDISNISHMPIADVVPRSEYDDLKMQFTELDIECSRLEKVEEQLHKIKQESTDFYCSFTQSKIQNCPIQDEIAKAKQEVARELIAEFKILAVNYVKDRDLLLVTFKNALAYAETELEKKYLGE